MTGKQRRRIFLADPFAREGRSQLARDFSEMTPTQKRLSDLRERQSKERGRMAELSFVDGPNDDAAQVWLEEQRWRGEPWCPHCGSFNVKHNNHRSMPWRCADRECRKRFSGRVGTPLQGSPLGYQIWVVAIYLLTTSVEGTEQHEAPPRPTGDAEDGMVPAHRIGKAFANGRGGPFEGPVEVDETYFGGKRKNMSNTERKELADAGIGRGAVGKVAVVGVKDRATNRVAATVVENTDAAILQGFVVGHTAPARRSIATTPVHTKDSRSTTIPSSTRSPRTSKVTCPPRRRQGRVASW